MFAGMAGVGSEKGMRLFKVCDFKMFAPLKCTAAESYYHTVHEVFCKLSH